MSLGDHSKSHYGGSGVLKRLPFKFLLSTAKENVKTASYGMVIVAGVGVTGIILYTIFQELFSGDSPNSLFQVGNDRPNVS